LISRWHDEKIAVVQTARQLTKLGLVTNANGNVSVRLNPHEGHNLFAITPSKKSYDSLNVDDIQVVDFDIDPVEGKHVPSSESLMHVGIYIARPNVGAVIHTHSVFASVAAVCGLDIPPIIDEMVVTIGGAINVTEYAFPSTQELANNVCKALDEKNAALIKNHGAVGVGETLEEALEVSTLTERVSQIFYYASLLGKIIPLPQKAVEAEASIFRMGR